MSLASETYAKLYVLSSKGTKFHPGCNYSQQITIEIKLFSIWRGGVGDSCRLQHLESPGSIPSRALFLGGDGYILFYFDTWIADSFAYYLFSFYLFSMEFMYNVSRTSSDGRIAPARIAGHPCKDKQYILIICKHGAQPRRGREI